MIKPPKKKNKPQKKRRSNEEREQAPAEEFIPFACHYDPHTLLTKNGELLQTIKITGFSFESVNAEHGEEFSLRQSIRKAALECVKTNNYALWFHTVRRKKNLSTGGSYKEIFSDYLNKAWCDRHDWEHKYVNELYITVICEGQSFGLGVKDFFRSLVFSAEKKYRIHYLEQIYEELNATVERILEQLVAYGVRRLTIVEQDAISYSEPLQFFGKILNLYEVPMKMPIMDLSTYLPTHNIAFGFNALEVSGTTGHHFGAILSIKEYHEVTSDSIDEFLQLDQEFIITETFDFINNELALKKFEHQQYILELSEDNELGRYMGLKDIVSSNRNSPVDFGEHQITIMLIEDDLDLLQQETERILDVFHHLGIVAIREDIMMEDCFWSQLPGNFEFLRRLTPINTTRIGGFASLYNFPAGRLNGNHWGDAVTVFYTKANTPYFFNFHDEDNGHTVIIGPYGAGKTVLLNFLTSESCKYNPRIFFFDQHRASELFIRALGGEYKRILKDTRSTQMRFNPLLLDDSFDNRQFLEMWLGYLIMDEECALAEAERDKIQQAIEYAFSLPIEQRKLSILAEKFWPIHTSSQTTTSENKQQNENVETLLQTAAEKPMLSSEEEVEPLASTPEERLTLWYGEGKFAHLFDNPEDELNLDQGSIFGFGMTEIVQEKWPLVPLFSYLTYCIEQSLDGRPTILVLDEAWSLVDNSIFAANLGDWLDRLRAKNAMVIFATESVDDIEESTITRSIINKMATQIYLPNTEATSEYKEVFGLSDKEFSMLTSMEKERRHFLLKHHGDAVVARLNLAGMQDVIAILSGNRENIALMESIVLELGDKPEQWFPAFCKKINAKVAKQ